MWVRMGGEGEGWGSGGVMNPRIVWGMVCGMVCSLEARLSLERGDGTSV